MELSCLPVDRVSHPGHHYVFAHEALRRYAFAVPAAVLAMLASNARTPFFDHLLQEIDSDLADADSRAFTGEDIGVTRHRFGERFCVVIRMPPATRCAEAYFVALVSRYPLSELRERASAGEAPLIDYYTLEHPGEVTLGQESFFCAWDREGAHLTFGAGPRPTEAHFVQALADFVRVH